jgi:ABC transporter substrate binding protein (PQQ-dependent alcohol dehydrogenase system)
MQTSSPAKLLLLPLLAALLLTVHPPQSANAADLVIGYIEMKRDVRYVKRRMFARYLTQSLGRPFVAAETALKETRFHGAETGTTFKLRKIKARDIDALKDKFVAAAGEGVRFFIADLAAQPLSAIADAGRDKNVLIFNISAREDSLRQANCAAHVLHIIPNDAMTMDALAQFLSLRRWREVLALVGPSPRDKALAKAFARSAKRFGLKIVDRRGFVLSNDPRQRRAHNLTLLTGKADYDVVFVADADGEFARDVPYSTAFPRPVVGAEGLAATAWHWAWDRHGAPQLEKRFEKKAKRPMRDADWAAWLAVKAVAEAVQRTKSADFEVLRAHLNSPDLVLDGFKGNKINFRPWDKQLRQPILIGTHNRVIERAPIEGFLHKDNNLDTLGFDRRESLCPLARK